MYKFVMSWLMWIAKFFNIITTNIDTDYYCQFVGPHISTRTGLNLNEYYELYHQANMNFCRDSDIATGTLFNKIVMIYLSALIGLVIVKIVMVIVDKIKLKIAQSKSEGFKCSPMVFGYYLKNKINNKDVISTFMYLAKKGYIDIEVKEHKEVILYKKQAIADEEIETVKVLFNEMFKTNDVLNITNQENYFINNYSNIKKHINKSAKKSIKLFTSTSKVIKYICLIISGLFWIRLHPLFNVFYLWQDNRHINMPLTNFLLFIVVLILIINARGIIKNKNNKDSIEFVINVGIYSVVIYVLIQYLKFFTLSKVGNIALNSEFAFKLVTINALTILVSLSMQSINKKYIAEIKRFKKSILNKKNLKNKVKSEQKCSFEELMYIYITDNDLLIAYLVEDYNLDIPNWFKGDKEDIINFFKICTDTLKVKQFTKDKIR